MNVLCNSSDKSSSSDKHEGGSGGWGGGVPGLPNVVNWRTCALIIEKDHVHVMHYRSLCESQCPTSGVRKYLRLLFCEVVGPKSIALWMIAAGSSMFALAYTWMQRGSSHHRGHLALATMSGVSNDVEGMHAHTSRICNKCKFGRLDGGT